MSSFDRRRFLQFSAASLSVLLDPWLRVGGLRAATPPQMMRRPFGANNPFGSELERLEAMQSVAVADWKWHEDTLPHPESPSLNDADWPIYELPTHGRPSDLSDKPAGMWFRKWVVVPKTMGGYNIEGLPVRLNLRLFYRERTPMRVFSNGTLVEMTPENTEQPILLTESAKAGQKFLIAAYAPSAGAILARLEVDYPPEKSNPRTMFEEILAVQALSPAFTEGKATRDSQLSAAVKTIDFGALDRGDQAGFDNSLAQADGKMAPLADWMHQFTIQAVGNSHIDLAWLWPWTEAVGVVRDTFRTVLELMDEFPGLTYAQSTAQDFLWLEEKYPEEFKAIQQRVKDGRWEMVGGMWCEPDLNMPSGESIVRQLLTGKRYFQQKFGVDVRIGWNPDSFGYSWQLAQIYKRSGVDYFVTQKIDWNDTTPFPYRLFWWESPDGSRVLTFFPNGYSNGIDPVQCAKFAAQDTKLSSGYKKLMMLYGVGDHGGGPTRAMLDSAVRWQKSPQAAFPKFEFSTSQEYFSGVEQNLSALHLPVWKDELYLQYHRGTYTTQAESKKRVRASERLMGDTEKFASMAMLHGQEYPQRNFEDCWRRLCFDQFHDLMAGSGLHVNYVDEAENLEFLRDAMQPVLRHSLELQAERADTRGPGRPVVVFNPLSWERTDVAEVEVQFPGPVAEIEVVDPAGKVLPSAVVSHDASTNTVKVRFLARGVPSIGYKVFHVVSTPHSRQAATTLRASGLAMENEYLRLECDPYTGCVTHLVDKKTGRNILRAEGKGNLLEAFVDKPRNWDAWDINLHYEQHKTELLTADEVKLVENTPVRAVIRVKKSYQGSSFVQDICMYPEVARADVHMYADWHEKHVMLKVAFPLDIRPLDATYEIPYGTIVRAAIPHVPGKPPVPFTEAKGVQTMHPEYDPLAAQEAEFEVCAQQWGDLSEDGRGFSLLSRDKFGYDTVEPGTIRLTLLRAPTYPDPHADQGPHDFTYGMFPHAGGWREGGTMHRAHEMNYHLHTVAAEAHEGPNPSIHSFASIEPANVMLSAIKKAEDDDSLIFRFVEFEGHPTRVRITLPEPATRAVETNLMEREEQPVSLGAGGQEFTVSIGAYEIKSVKVAIPHAAGPTPPRRV
jgi:alpha-mannosidase